MIYTEEDFQSILVSLDNGEIVSMVEYIDRVTDPLKIQVREVKAALAALKMGDECWCEHAINNPHFKDHTKGCKLAQAVMGKTPLPLHNTVQGVFDSRSWNGD